MKLTFVTDTLSSGGSERVMSVIANELSSDYDIEIICLRMHVTYYPLLPNVKVTFAEDVCGNSLFKKFIWLRKYVSKDSVIIAFMVPVYVFTLASLLFTKHKIIVSERNDPDSASVFRRIARRLLLWRAQKIVVQTKSVADRMPRYSSSKQVIIYNPISDKYVCGKGLETEKENLLISVGRLSPQKNQKMMIDGFSEFLTQHPDYRLEIYGEGEIHDELTTYIKKKNLEEKVILMGRCNNLQDVLPKAKIFVMTSDYEGMSNAMMEALYVGLPVVTTAVSGTEELIVNGENGIVIPIGDKDAFTNAIINLAGDEKRLESMAKKAMMIKEKVQLSSIIPQWNSLINSLVIK